MALKIRNFLEMLIKDIFYISFVSYLFFVALDLLIPGFVSNFFNLNIILIISAVSGIITLINHNQKSHD